MNFYQGHCYPDKYFPNLFCDVCIRYTTQYCLLSGLTLAIGLLVDNAIIVLENINRHRSETHSIFEAAREGTREITLAVTASTLTTINV